MIRPVLRYFIATLLAFTSTSLIAKPWKSGEVISRDYFLFGAFEARLQASSGSGGITAFFLLKDYSWVPGAEWQELDFEFLGKSGGRQFQTQIMTPGVPRTEHNVYYKTSEDVSKGFHTYRIEWTPDYLAFYYDGKLIRRETDRMEYAKFLDRRRVEAMPLRFSLWAGFSDWSGLVDENSLPTPVYVDSFRYYRYDERTRTFSFAWEDKFDSWDDNRWYKANWTFEYAVNDYTHDRVSVEDGKLQITFGR
jgi:beta-glucanase (GH16 family)